jgi:hypothetical protein
MAVSLNTTYHVDDGVVTLTIVIGDGQLGSSRVSLDDTIIGQGDAIENLRLGEGSGLDGKTLAVKSVVTDVNDQTNHTSITYSLRGGAAPADYELDATVAEEGDSVIYRATIALET